MISNTELSKLCIDKDQYSKERRYVYTYVKNIMAKTNQVDILGYLKGNPKVLPSHKRAVLTIRIARGTRDTGAGEKQFKAETVIVRTSNHDIVNYISNLSERDFVRIKGVITTRYVPKKCICENCGRDNVIEGIFTYIEPIFIDKIAHADTTEDADLLLEEKLEISNQVRVLGNLCYDPREIPLKKTTACRYQIGIPRTYRIQGSNDDEKSDFPYINTYGNNAKRDLASLKERSQILVDGCLQSRRLTHAATCSCGNIFKWMEDILEIAAYEVEYLKNYNDPYDNENTENNEQRNKSEMNSDSDNSIEHNEENEKDSDNNGKFVESDDDDKNQIIFGSGFLQDL